MIAVTISCAAQYALRSTNHGARDARGLLKDVALAQLTCYDNNNSSRRLAL